MSSLKYSVLNITSIKNVNYYYYVGNNEPTLNLLLSQGIK